jgi:hypothetical protein
VTLVIFLAILAIFGLPSIGLGALIICTLAAWVDEVGNDRERFKGKKIVETFLQLPFHHENSSSGLGPVGGILPTPRIPASNLHLLHTI